MRDKIAQKLEDTWFETEHMEDLWLQMADVPIKLISNEIEKVENPFLNLRTGPVSDDAFEGCRQKILSLLK